MFPALAYVGKTLASVKKRSGGEPAAKPWVSCWFMSDAAMTSTLLPVLSSHGLTVSCWSLTSAGPFEVIMNFSVTGPLLAGWLAPPPDPLSNPLPPPHAASARAPARPAASAAVARLVLRDIVVLLTALSASAGRCWCCVVLEWCSGRAVRAGSRGSLGVAQARGADGERRLEQDGAGMA